MIYSKTGNVNCRRIITLKQSMGRGKELNLTLYKIKLSRKKNIAVSSYKIQNESTNPTFPCSSDVDGKQLYTRRF